MMLSGEHDLLPPGTEREEAIQRLKSDLMKSLGVFSVNEFTRYYVAYVKRCIEAKKLESYESSTTSKEFDRGFVRGMESLVIELETWMRGE